MRSNINNKNNNYNKMSRNRVEKIISVMKNKKKWSLLTITR